MALNHIREASIIEQNAIFKPSTHVDFFIFVLHNFTDGEVKKEIKLMRSPIW